jgi:hypothetical protein
MITIITISVTTSLDNTTTTKHLFI